jgi:ABC-type transport system involved in cytochrome bd biosynthesis fused ATPase/permease subunit
MFESLIFIAWLIGLVTHVAIVIALYHLGEQRFGTGTTWAVAAFVFGIFALIAFGLIVFYDASLQRAKEVEERGRIKRFMEEYQKLRETEQEPNVDHARADVRFDSNIDRLLAGGNFSAARDYALDQLRTAHEQGNKTQEEKYRLYIERINQAVKEVSGESS